MKCRHVLLTTLCLWSWVGCSEPASQRPSELSEPDLPAPDLTPTPDLTPDQGVDLDGEVAPDAPEGDLDPGDAAPDANGDDLAPDLPAEVGEDLTPDSPPDVIEPPCADEDADGVCDEVERARCEDLRAPALSWPEADAALPLPGAFELAQLYTYGPDDARIRPRHVAQRDLAVIFSPGEALPPATPLLLSAWDGERLLGVLAMRGPERPLPWLEDRWMEAPLPPYRAGAWAAVLPWSWVREGVQVQVGFVDDARRRHVQALALEGLGAPHVLTISRNKMVLFGEPGFDTQTSPAERLARDLFASIPAAELRVVDALPWRLPYIIARTPEGPRRADSEAALQAISEDDHYFFLKHQFSLRISLANTGRGLAVTDDGGDSSPYGSGTALGMGWYRGEDGQYEDLDDIGVAGGWTGWTSVWNGRDSECGNAWIHELGHSFTLLHFTDGAAADWGIDDEYPQDGVQLPSHPTAFHSLERAFRAWHRVTPQGPARDEQGQLIPRHDPMNGGEPADASSCYPPYTAWQAKRAQAWFQDSPALRREGGVSGLYRWDEALAAYQPVAPAPEFQRPLEVDVPVVTLIGTLGLHEEANQIYPPLWSPLGNTFAAPDPADPSLDARFDGATWFVEVEYEDGAIERALIAHGPIQGPELGLFSLNVALSRGPVQARLLESPTPYPNMDLERASLAFARDLGPAPSPLPPVAVVGRGSLGGGALRVAARCEDGLNCAERAARGAWRDLPGALTFHGEGLPEAATSCLTEPGARSTLRVPIQSDRGEQAELVLYAQRVVGEEGVATALHDGTRWVEGPDVPQEVRVWAPYEANAALPAGRWALSSPRALQARLDGQLWASLPLEIDLVVHEAMTLDLGAPQQTPAIMPANSGAFFVVTDPLVGPTEGVWWGEDAPVVLSVLAINPQTQARRALRVAAWQESSCGGRWQLNAGRGAGDCVHHARLELRAQDNPGLSPGERWETPPSAPLLLEGWRWHSPRTRLGVFALHLTFTAP